MEGSGEGWDLGFGIGIGIGIWGGHGFLFFFVVVVVVVCMIVRSMGVVGGWLVVVVWYLLLPGWEIFILVGFGARCQACVRYSSTRTRIR